MLVKPSLVVPAWLLLQLEDVSYEKHVVRRVVNHPERSYLHVALRSLPPPRLSPFFRLQAARPAVLATPSSVPSDWPSPFHPRPGILGHFGEITSSIICNMNSVKVTSTSSRTLLSPGAVAVLKGSLIDVGTSFFLPVVKEGPTVSLLRRSLDGHN